MKTLTLLAAAMLSALALGPDAEAHDFKAGALVIDHPWSRPTLPNRPSAAYFELVNTGEATDTLLSATTPAFARTELHETLMTDGVMSMQAQDSVPLPAGETVTFEPGGLHVMLFDPTEPLAEGASFPMTLTFEKAGDVEVTVNVEMGSGGHDHGADHGSGHGSGHGSSHGTTN